MGRTTYYDNAMPGFIADPASIIRNTGRQIDWEQVSPTRQTGTAYTVQTNDADATTGDTALTVDALLVALPKGAILDFGTLAADAYTVTVGGTPTAEGGTSLGVVALPVAIPAGTVLDFGLHSVDSVAMIATVAADAAAGATSLTIVATGHQIQAAATADFPGAAQRMIAKLSAAAAAGATALTVYPLNGPIPDNSTASYIPNPGKKKIPAGTIMAELSSGKIIPRADVTASETSTCILLSGANEGSEAAAETGFGCLVGGVLYKNILPDAAESGFATWIGELNGTSVGQYVWQTYADDSGS